jgi:adenylate cyclase
LVFLRIVDPYPVEALRLGTFDYYQRLKHRDIPPHKSSPVTIVTIDEASLAEYGQWPWPRSIVADVVRKLHKSGADVIALDILFAEPDRAGTDAEFAKVIRSARVVLGSGAYRKEVHAAIYRRKKSRVDFFGLPGDEAKKFLPEVEHIVLNIFNLWTEAASEGVFSLSPDRDGRLRRMATFFSNNGQTHPSFGVKILRDSFESKAILVVANEAGIKSVSVRKGTSIPTDAWGLAWLYFSRSDPAKYVSLRDVLSGMVSPEAIKGKIALDGTDAVGLGDIHPTPVSEGMAGVEFHAQFLENAILKTFLSRPSHLIGVELVIFFVAGLIVIILMPMFSVGLGAVTFLSVVGGLGRTFWYLFS